MGLGSRIALLVAPIVAAKVIDFIIDLYYNYENEAKIEHDTKEKPK